MASGDPVVQVLEALPPATLNATMDTMSGGSTPAEVVPVWDFDDSTAEYMDFKCRLVGYGSSGLTVRLYWSSNAIAGDVVWEAAVRRVQEAGEDIDAAHVYGFNSVTATTPGTAGQLDYAAVTFSDGADMDNWDDGEIGILRVRRLATSGSDTLSGDAELWAVAGEES